MWDHEEIEKVIAIDERLEVAENTIEDYRERITLLEEQVCTLSDNLEYHRQLSKGYRRL